MKKSFTSVGTNKSDEKPDYKKTILDDISKLTTIPFRVNEEVLKRQTFLLKEDTIEKIKDIVYTEKMAGNLLFTQKELIEQALEVYLVNKNITKRPAEFIEKRGRKN